MREASLLRIETEQVEFEDRLAIHLPRRHPLIKSSEKQVDLLKCYGSFKLILITVVNVRTKNSATFRDAQLLLLLYKLRRETRLREARRWFVRCFRPQTAAEFQQLCPAGSEQEESFRMVYSYWEMAASFVTAGILNEELFVHNSSELLLVWSRLQPLVREWRQAWHNPQTVKNIEQVAARAAQYLNEGDPDSHATFISMINGRDISL